jgi:GntR family transcriptional regulator
MPTGGRLRADQRPLYVRASEAYRNLIRSGEYKLGDRLPSEIELSQQWGISRPTLREALRLLEEEGVITRRHGVGTFVAAPRPVLEGGLEVLESLERMAERHGLHTHMGECNIEARSATPRELRGLALDKVAEVTVVTRVIMAGEERVAFLTDIVPGSFLRADELQSSGEGIRERFNGSVLDLFLERGWPMLAHSRTELAAEGADTELARSLHIQRGAPLLKLEAQLYAQDGRVVDYSISHFIHGYFRFHVVRRIG